MTESRYSPGDQLQPKEPPAFGMETLVGSILLGGVALSSALLAIGVIWHWIITGHLELEYLLAGANFPEFLLDDIRQLFSNAIQPRSFVDLGLAILMITPYVRVLASIVYFAFAERDWKYSVFTAFVFTVLTYSLFQR
jgi:uncharacterized membrane protein